MFDTAVTFTGDKIALSERLRLFMDLHALSDEFERCYDVTANEIQSVPVKNLLNITDSIAKKYDENHLIDLTCGELTRVWGVSTSEPRVPSDIEIENALLAMTNGEYFGGDFSKFPAGTLIDPGAAAKGYATDEALNYLSETSAKWAVLSFGSSVLLYGEKPENQPFEVGIKNENGEVTRFFETSAAFVSTSGGSERGFSVDGVYYSHIFDMKTGYPVKTDLQSVTVVVSAETENGGVMADYLSTLIYIEGTKSVERFMCDEFSFFATDLQGKTYGNLTTEVLT
ncbi:MAG: FAD:protein FMN transferase [Ruminococcus sp.]|jgi:thiamine biosynthesis lipoprotein|nr:FAD:protein FMN transferase [Ruminococcus sp.]